MPEAIGSASSRLCSGRDNLSGRRSGHERIVAPEDSTVRRMKVSDLDVEHATASAYDSPARVVDSTAVAQCSPGAANLVTVQTVRILWRAVRRPLGHGTTNFVL